MVAARERERPTSRLREISGQHRRLEHPQGQQLLDATPAGDPVDGAWETFIKYGKLGPDFGLENVFKRPLVLFRPGACFRGHAPQPWVGRSVPMAELLAPDAATALAARNTNVMHLAFGLALPAILK